jgi:hypothetical protein
MREARRQDSGCPLERPAKLNLVSKPFKRRRQRRDAPF